MKSNSPAPSSQAVTQLNAATKLHKGGQNPKALAIIQRLLSKNPRFGDAHYLATGVLVAMGDNPRALYHAQQAQRADPSNANFHAAVGLAHTVTRNYTESILHYTRALELSADHPDALNGLGIAYKETGQTTQSARILDRLLAIQPDNQEAIINRALLDSDAGLAHPALLRLNEASRRFPKNPILHDVLAVISSYDDQITPGQAFEIHQRFGRVMRSHIRAKATHPNDPDPARKLRIGYISAEFRRHSNSFFLPRIIEHHNHDQFETFLYSTNKRHDKITDRLIAAGDHWRLHKSNDLRGIIDAIAKDKIDILIELTGHFSSNNLPIMAAKPAPVQITYLGYANTTGLGTIDYRIIDHTTDPAPQGDALNTETLIRLDPCFLTFEPASDLPTIQDPDPDRPFTFASFNDLKKLTPSAVDTWAEILKQAPHTRLILKNTQFEHQQARELTLERFTTLGIDPSRIQILGRIESMHGHLDLYNTIDLGLDTFPYAGTTTTCEALTMGIPVLTLVGDTHACRVGASILQTIGREDLCAPSTEDYIRTAVEHANAGKLQTDAREKLRQQIIDSPLCDAPAFVPKLEAAYRYAWTQWCQRHGAKQ